MRLIITLFLLLPQICFAFGSLLTTPEERNVLNSGRNYVSEINKTATVRLNGVVKGKTNTVWLNDEPGNGKVDGLSVQINKQQIVLKPGQQYKDQKVSESW